MDERPTKRRGPIGWIAANPWRAVGIATLVLAACAAALVLEINRMLDSLNQQ
jgi:hypothetical protein